MIEARDFDDRFETLEDVLRHAAGVHVRRFGGLGSYSTAGIRGSRSEQVLVLLDGVRLNSARSGSVDLSTLPLRQIERIHVVRGGGAARYGSDALGGLISITTRRPEEEAGADVSALAGTLGTLGADALLYGERAPEAGDAWPGAFSGTLAWSRLGADNDFRFERGAGSRQGAGIPIRRQDFTRLNADFVQDTGLAKGALETGPDSELNATLHLHRTDRGQPGPVTGGTTDETVQCPSADENYRRGVVSLGGAHHALGPGELQGAFFHRREEQELHDPGGACKLIDVRGSDPRDRSQAIDQETGVDLAYATRPLALGPLGLRTRSAVTLRRDATRAQLTDDAGRDVATLFLQQEIALAGGALRLLPAVGLDAANTGSVSTVHPGTGAPLEVQPDDDAEWLPRVGAILRLAPGLRARANYRRAYRRPNFNELFFPDLGYVRGNPELRPEDGWSFDVGLEYARDRLGPLGGLRGEVAWFHHDVDDTIEWVQINQFTTQPLNMPPATLVGWEVAGSFSLLDRLDLSATYTFLDSEMDVLGTGSGPPLPHRPRNQVSARAALGIGVGSAWSELQVEDDSTRSPTGRIGTEGSTQLDVGLSVAPSRVPGLRWMPPGWEIATEWINVTDVSRVDSLGMPLPGTVWYLRLRGRIGGDGDEP